LVLIGCNKNNSSPVNFETEIASKEIKPLVVMLERNPWANLIGGESPTFAFYNNGLLIFRRQKTDMLYEYVSVILNSEERDKFIEYLSIKEDFLKLNDYYNLFEPIEITDQDSTEIYVWNNNKMKLVEIYGSLKEKCSKPKQHLAPKIFMELYNKINKYSNSKATHWLPKKIEVVIWDFSYSKKPTVKWPDGWPDINSKDTVKRKNGGYQIFLNPVLQDKLIELFNKIDDESTAFLINGKKWTIQPRDPFPCEEQWHKKSKLYGD